MDDTNMLAVFGHLQSLLEIRDFGSAKRLCERMISALPPGNPGKTLIEQVYQKISPLSWSAKDISSSRDKTHPRD